MTPLAESRGGDDHERRTDWEVKVVQVTSAGGSSGVPSPVYCTISSDIGPEPMVLYACTTTEYSVYILSWRYCTIRTCKSKSWTKRNERSDVLLEIGDFELVFFALFAIEFDSSVMVRFIGWDQFVTDVVALDITVPVVFRRRFPSHSQRMTIHWIHFDIARSRTRSCSFVLDYWKWIRSLQLMEFTWFLQKEFILDSFLVSFN